VREREKKSDDKQALRLVPKKDDPFLVLV